jgi:protein involved in polysaccharide export with SLBB domain
MFFLILSLGLQAALLTRAAAQQPYARGSPSLGQQTAPVSPPIPATVRAQTYPFSTLPADVAAPTPATSAPAPASAAPAVETVKPVGGGAAVPGAQVLQAPPTVTPAKPFGSQFFLGQPQLFGPTAFNRDYIVGTGDQISIQVWGSYTYSGVQGVDPQGSIFIPQVGPIQVAGVTNKELNNRVTDAVKKVFTQNVEVYATLLSKQPVAVYVTGAVQNPGRYSGDRQDSPLQYIAQAGGINPASGSYRDIRITRAGKTIAHVDLYAVLAGAELPPVQFEVNDTIHVGFQEPTVTAQGAVENPYRFELQPRELTGEHLIALARPDPTVSNVSVQGIRGGTPYNAYVSLAEFRIMHLANGDTYQFTADYVSATIFVAVTGQSAGPSSFVVPRGARLGELLRLVEVDPVIADLSSIYLRRQSVALQQQQALNQALDQLRRSVLTNRSVSSSDASINAQEAQLVEAFIQQVQAYQPQGIVVLATAQNRDRILFEPNDQIVIPSKSDVVLVTGEVRFPQTLVFNGGTLGGYLGLAGGFTDRADTSTFVVLHSSGEVETGGDYVRVRPGDQIMVMPLFATHRVAIAEDITHILYNLVVSTGVVFRLTGIIK